MPREVPSSGQPTDYISRTLFFDDATFKASYSSSDPLFVVLKNYKTEDLLLFMLFKIAMRLHKKYVSAGA